jgi:hypothetical protein
LARVLAQGRMPLHWTIDSRERLVVAVVDGEVTRAEIQTYLDALVGAKALPYRKLFDASRGDTAMGPEEMMALGAMFRSFHARGEVGPLAIVVPDDKIELVSRVLGILAAADRPMRVFRETEPARRWIESLAKEQT